MKQHSVFFVPAKQQPWKFMSDRKLIRVDLHMHTSHSPDSLTSPAQLVRRARAAGLDRVAVTDHGVFTGAQEAYWLDPELVIRGEEIKCSCGTHLIGLFLQEGIPNRLPVEETARRIREQGGVVYAPHPFAYLRSPSARAKRALAVADVVEVFNARAFVPAWNRLAAERANGQPGFTASDSHFPWEVGRVYTELPAFDDVKSFMRAARFARAGRLRVTNPFVHAFSMATEAVRTGLWLRRG
jgi:predicted metal-dependent phosphoesterase TrpH